MKPQLRLEFSMVALRSTNLLLKTVLPFVLFIYNRHINFWPHNKFIHNLINSSFYNEYAAFYSFIFIHNSKYQRNKAISCQYFYFIPAENTRKPKFSDVFRGYKWKHWPDMG